MQTQKSETDAQKHARLVSEILAHPETLAYHPSSGHEPTHADTFDHFTIAELEEILANANKKLAPTS